MDDKALDAILTAPETRVLGSLMEKQMTTPDYYPLTLKALASACNQKSSRTPVMCLSDSEVAGIVSRLRTQGLVTTRMDGRADRFEQHLSRKLGITTKERAVLCVLMLRSALTLNEIRINTGRMVEFDSSEDVQQTLDALIKRDDALVVRIPRAAGQREDRFAQLLCGDVDIEPAAGASSVSPDSGGTRDRIDRLESEVEALKVELQGLRELIETRAPSSN